MRNPFLPLAFAAALLISAASAARAADDKPIPAPPAAPSAPPAIDMSGIIGSGEPAAITEDAVPGDHRRFTINTDTDISLLNVGDLYVSEGPGDKSLYKVVDIPAKGSAGGTIVFERIAGNVGDIPEKLRRQDTGQPASIARRITLFDLYRQGGPFLHPIALLGLFMIVLTANGFWIYRYRRQLPRRFIEQSRIALKNGDVKGFRALALGARGLLPSVSRAMTERFASSTIDEMKERTEIAASRQIHRLRLPVKMLNLIAAAAPLLGLLGTIVGMVIVFEAVAGATGAAKAAALAAGIRVKLFSTALALIVAIPSLFAFFFFNARLGGIIAECEIISEQFIHRLSLIKRAGGGADQDDDAPAEEPAASTSAGDDEEEQIVVVKKKPASKPSAS